MSYISYFVPRDSVYFDTVESSLRSPWPYNVSLLATKPALNVQLLNRMASLISKFCDRYSDRIFGTCPVVPWRYRAVKKMGAPFTPCPARPPGMVIDPQPFDVRARSSASRYHW